MNGTVEPVGHTSMSLDTIVCANGPKMNYVANYSFTANFGRIRSMNVGGAIDSLEHVAALHNLTPVHMTMVPEQHRTESRHILVLSPNYAGGRSWVSFVSQSGAVQPIGLLGRQEMKIYPFAGPSFDSRGCIILAMGNYIRRLTLTNTSDGSAQQMPNGLYAHVAPIAGCTESSVVKVGFSDNVDPRLALFSSPTDTTIDREDNIYVAEAGMNRIRRIDARTGAVTTFATITSPCSIVYDMMRNLLYVGGGDSNIVILSYVDEIPKVLTTKRTHSISAPVVLSEQYREMNSINPIYLASIRMGLLQWPPGLAEIIEGFARTPSIESLVFTVPTDGGGSRRVARLRLSDS